MKADCVWLAALLEQTHSVWEQRAILHLLQICIVPFSGPRLEKFDWVVSCFGNPHFKCSTHSIVQGIKNQQPLFLSLEYCGGWWGAKLTFPMGRWKMWMVKLLKSDSKVNERKIKTEKEEICSPSWLQCTVFPHPL